MVSIVGLYLVFKPPPPPGTSMAEWQDHANSVCEQFYPSIETNLSAAQMTLNRMKADRLTGKAGDFARADALAGNIEGVANSYRNLMGHLRDIKRPEKEGKQIEDVLDAGSDVAANMASAARSIKARDTQGTDLALASGTTSLGIFKDKVGGLGINQCQGYKPPPAPPGLGEHSGIIRGVGA
ncbi:hypothetical protein GCM10010347_66320 [Streptomyces cirratus]|uniref:Uncharacterized protein n=1 Tax=Streptomyces cirratus TaxID=68187 RepID=A0ABQ3F5S0_9ACTN|nr:hypothetical protein [Streptomyces cirratus]GHB86002.1 hypothetical protein GCM10010347_66320 [Streptomyces cirratus]